TIASNRLNRRFTTPVLIQKLITDITEFKCLESQKLYLSPIMDLYDREIISVNVFKRPTLDIVMKPLPEVLSIVREHALFRTAIHSIVIKDGITNIIPGSKH